MKLALGTAQFGLEYGVANVSGRTTLEDALLILKLGREFGLDTLDTAITYGDSEAVLGKSDIHAWNVISKIPEVPESCNDVSEWVREQIQGSLRRLGIYQLHGVLLHRPDQLLKKMGPVLFEALQAMKSEGLVRKAGISVYSPIELDIFFEKYQFDLIQSPFNILDRRLVESGWAARLKAAGVEVHTRSTFLQGLLLMSNEQRPPKFDLWQTVWQEWKLWLADSGLTPLQACLQFAISQEYIDRVVVGVDTSKQFAEIIRASDGKIFSPPFFSPLRDDRLLNPVAWNQL